MNIVGHFGEDFFSLFLLVLEDRKKVDATKSSLSMYLEMTRRM